MHLLCFLAGATHMLAPDHWVPTSIFAWQRGWRTPRVIAFGAAALLMHVLLGTAIYFAFLYLAEARAETTRDLLAWSFGTAIPLSLFRVLRYKKMGGLLQLPRNPLYAGLSVLSLLGPCEFLIPVMMKGRVLGLGYLTPVAAFLAGSALSGLLAMALGRRLWHRPLWLTEALYQVQSRATALPITAALVIGLIATLR